MYLYCYLNFFRIIFGFSGKNYLKLIFQFSKIFNFNLSFKNRQMQNAAML
jgi:hypothetical protein